MICFDDIKIYKVRNTLTFFYDPKFVVGSELPRYIKDDEGTHFGFASMTHVDSISCHYDAGSAPVWYVKTVSECWR